MPCTRPLQAFRDEDFSITFDFNKAIQPGISYWRKVYDVNGKGPFAVECWSNAILLPCGNCISCRVRRSREWAARCVHEAKIWNDFHGNSFITLTYSDKYLPFGGTLVKKHFQDFMKRLRYHFDRDIDNGIRVYYCGEYGEQTKRPHYHALLFNCSFDDQKLFKVRQGHRLFTSEILSSLWPYGHSSIGAVTFESAAYVSRYCMKKINGKNSVLHYQGREKEFGQPSTRPGLGKFFFEKYFSDIYPSDEIILGKPEQGVYRMKPPRYYDKLLESRDPDLFNYVKCKREEFYLNSTYDPQSLVNSEKVLTSKLKTLSRVLEFNY